MANLELKTASGGSVTLVPEDGVSNVTATVKHESGVLASEAQVEQAEFLAGVGRTWQDVTANRSVGVTYTNNTGRDIVLSILGGNTSSTAYSMDLFVDGEQIWTANMTISGSSRRSTVAQVIPNGSTYSVVLVNITLGSWWELR